MKSKVWFYAFVVVLVLWPLSCVGLHYYGQYAVARIMVQPAPKERDWPKGKPQMIRMNAEDTKMLVRYPDGSEEWIDAPPNK